MNGELKKYPVFDLTFISNPYGPFAHNHSHSHGHSHPDLKGRNLIISILLNILITVSQVIGGLISGSLSLLSDALHNFSDVLSLIISYIATYCQRKKHQPIRPLVINEQKLLRRL